MRVKVSKKITKELNKRAINNYCIEFFNYLEMSPDQYAAFFIDSVFDHENDYDYNTNKMKVIQITYKPELYALPKYLTTNDLIREYRPGDTANSYLQRVINSVLI